MRDNDSLMELMELFGVADMVEGLADRRDALRLNAMRARRKARVLGLYAVPWLLVGAVAAVVVAVTLRRVRRSEPEPALPSPAEEGQSTTLAGEPAGTATR